MTYAHKSGAVVPFRARPANTPPTPLLNKFTAHVSRAKTPDAILDGLDEFAGKLLPVNVLGVGRIPRRTSDWRSIQLGRDVFLHRSAPVEWWNEYAAKAAQGYDPGCGSAPRIDPYRHPSATRCSSPPLLRYAPQLRP